MKKLLAILLVGCLLITSVFSASVYAESEYDLTTKTLTMPEIAGKYKTQGRTVLQDDILMAHYPATGIEFNAYCSGDVSVTFNVTSLANETAGCYFTVIVDGVKMARDFCHITATGDVTLTIAEGLTEGEHNFEIYRQNEITHANLGFKSITLNGELLDAPANKDTYIEFVGASQWGGWGNLADSTVANDTASSAAYQDATQSLTYLTAQNLDTDWSVVSVAGIGAYWCNLGYSMNTAYDYIGYYNDKNTIYDFARQPDYVVIGLGTNDVSKAEANGKTEEDIYEACNYFIRLMRIKNPNAKIIWVHGMMTEAVDKYVEKAIEDLGGAEYGVYNVKVTQNNDGGSSHPSAAGHAVIAEEVSAFIDTIKEDTFTSELPKKADAPDPEGEVLIESDFSSTTNWTRRTPANVTYVDEDSDGTNDFARLTSSSTATVALRSTPFTLIPGNKYELTYYIRVPEGSAAYVTDSSAYYPRIAFYQPTLNAEGTQVTDNYSVSANDYAYKDVRRSDFISSWQIGEYGPYTRARYSAFDSSIKFACANATPEEAYNSWTKVTVEFTAIDDEANGAVGDQITALYFSFNQNKKIDGLLYDIKDVKLINTSYVEPEEPTEGEVFYEGFETLTDATTVIKNGITATWPKIEVTDTEAATGTKSAKVFSPHNYVYIPLDKTTLAENSTYDFSLNWKMLEYTETKARRITKLQLVGWNPSTGEALKNATAIAGITNINATGEWINSGFSFSISDLDAYEEFVIRLHYASTENTPGENDYTQAEDSIWIDDIKIVGEIVEKDEASGKVIIESDFSDDSKWYGYPSYNVSTKDDNADEVEDYYQITTGSVNKASYLRSEPATLIPGNEYEFSFYARIPSDSPSYSTDTANYYPRIAIYQPTVDYETGKVTDGHSEGQNEYAYKGNGTTTILRRTNFSADWKIGDYEPYTRSYFSSFESQHKDACGGLSPNEVYKDWTKVTATFTAIEDENNVGPQVVAFSIGIKKGIAGLKLDIKDVKLVNKTVTNDVELPEGVIYFEDFENKTDATVGNIITNRTWSEPYISTTEVSSGEKALGIYGMYEYLFIPFDKTALTENTIYEFSMDWKLLEYTTDKKRQISKLYFVGYNPSKGETIKDNAVHLAYLEAIKGTGDWVNTVLRLRVSDLSAYEQFGIYLRYTTSGTYTEEEDTMYIDNIKLAEAEDQSVLTPINLNEAERTEDTIKVLAFGNSFSNDATTFIPEIAKADGKDIRVGDCSIGGCSLLRHYNNMFNGTTDYTFNYRDPAGKSTFSKVSMYQALTATDWDYITIQQVSGNSGKIDTFEPYLSELLAYFKEVCPNAEIRFHMTWAYEHEYSGLSNYENSQTVMYEAIIDTYLQASKNHGYVRLIPSGEAIQRLRATDEFAEQSLNRDGFHLSDKGRLTAALVWYETFTGISALDAKFDLTTAIGTVSDTVGVNVGVTAEEDLVMRTAAHEAASLYKKANETQLAIEAIGTVTEESGEAIETANTLRTELGNDTLLPNLQTLIDANEAYAEFTPDFVAGDITGDTSVDLTDVNLLAQYLAGWNVEVNEDALDTDGDGLINLNDLILLAQFVAGWDVELA